MTYASQPARIGARGFDSVAHVDANSAGILKRDCFDFAVRYLGGLQSGELAVLLATGMAVMPVTYADMFDGPGAVRALQALGFPAGVTVWLDVEGIQKLDAPTLIKRINDWALAVHQGGYDPGMYVGPQSLLTSEELWHLAVDRYWKSGARIIDRNGSVATLEARCGWAMQQLYPGNLSVPDLPFAIDIDIVQEDYYGRAPNWCIAA